MVSAPLIASLAANMNLTNNAAMHNNATPSCVERKDQPNVGPFAGLLKQIAFFFSGGTVTNLQQLGRVACAVATQLG